jgi:hypothetical protein
MRKKIFLILLIGSFFPASSQYDPAAGQPGSKAISKDSSIFVSWADTCFVQRGLQNALDSSGALASHGKSEDAIGKADGTVVSLGDGGHALLKFNIPVVDGPGPDFAVFENAFTDNFLELAFVEVSSDGQRFVRFPSVSLTDTTIQKGAFDPLDPTKIHNLAGKHRLFFGTPFDLAELADSQGLDLMNIQYIRIVDVVGSLNDKLARFDSRGVKINDPFPTDFESSGFDLDAIGVIHNQQSITNLPEISENRALVLYPNPANKGEKISIRTNGELSRVVISDMNGRVVNILNKETVQAGWEMDKAGIFLVSIEYENGLVEYMKLIVNK